MMIIRPKNKNRGVEDAGQLADCVARTELWVPSKLGVGAQTWLWQWIPVSATEEFDARRTQQGPVSKTPKDSRRMV